MDHAIRLESVRFKLVECMHLCSVGRPKNVSLPQTHIPHRCPLAGKPSSTLGAKLSGPPFTSNKEPPGFARFLSPPSGSAACHAGVAAAASRQRPSHSFLFLNVGVEQPGAGWTGLTEATCTR